MTVLPPGPFPPRTTPSEGVVDLGASLRDACYTAATLSGPVRRALGAQLQDLIRGRRWPQAAVVLAALVDTWPLSAVIDPARTRWAQDRPAGADLDTLARAATLLGLAFGWQPLGAGPWPCPDAEWLRRQLSDPPTKVFRHAHDDGAMAVAHAFDLDEQAITAPPPASGAGVARLSPDDLPARRAALARALARGTLRAVHLEGPLPDWAPHQLAWGELRMEAAHQDRYDRYGLAGLTDAGRRPWTEALRPAPAGQPGDLKPLCDWALLPGTPAQVAEGQLSPVCFLLWEGPHPPVPAQPQAVTVLRELAGLPTAGLPPVGGAARDALVEALIGLGALSA
ncbi:MAG: hypothetical protein H6739_26620 [Alphaproteobacteria bacterium]|nr:hypothetical protein [Alphaproteobacteria bacterium]